MPQFFVPGFDIYAADGRSPARDYWEQVKTALVESGFNVMGSSAVYSIRNHDGAYVVGHNGVVTIFESQIDFCVCGDDFVLGEYGMRKGNPMLISKDGLEVIYF